MSSPETTCKHCDGPADWVEQTHIPQAFGDGPATGHVRVAVCRQGCVGEVRAT